MLVKQSFIEDLEGNVLVSHVEDHTEVARLNHEEKMSNAGWTKGREMRQVLRIPPREYHEWEQRWPGCWNNKNFVRSYVKEHPQYATVKGNSI